MSGPDKPVWTPAQRRAFTLFEADVCVPAGAGSGKTAVLVERYLHAVENRGLQPSEILAITFTDKAAAEMKRRVIEESLRRGLSSLRAQLESAPIGTIHAFCIRLLRENPVECGIDPEFRVLGDAERELMISRVAEEMFEVEALDPQTADVLALYGPEELRDAWARLLEKGRASGRRDFLAAEPDFEALEKSLRMDLDASLAALLACEKAQWSDTERRTREAAQRARQVLRQPAGWPRWRALEPPIGAMHAGSKLLKEPVQSAKLLYEDWRSAEAARLLLPARRTFLRLFNVFCARLEQEKRRTGAYDFDDLIDKALQALRAPDPIGRAWAEATRRRFKAIFVDEYQDVNPAQAALVEQIKSPGNLFVVGDRRQSIYGFRNADPSLFDRIRESAAAAPLAENFRSREPVLDFVNAFFADRFTQDEPLTAARRYDPKLQPSIEILAVPVGAGADDKPLDRARVAEAAALAARLRALVDSRCLVEPKGGMPRPVEWGDIAVLFRKSTAIRLYDKAFRDAGIPFDLPKGKGYFEKNEITDLISYIQVLSDPSNDIALAAVLRSPLAGLSDDALFELAQSRPAGGCFFDALGAGSRLAAPDREKLDAFRSRFDRLRFSHERLGLARLLEELVEETAYRESMAHVAGPQALANIDKLIDLAREADSAGSGLEDFVRLVRALARREDDEPEARMPAEPGNAVSFLTVHSAKGLEFPVVALADLGAEPKTDHPLFRVSSDGELGLRLQSPEDWEWVRDPAYRKLSAASAAAALDESDRLLYVAMTRAREHLILSGAWKAPAKSSSPDKEKSWMRRIFETCGFAQPHAPGLEHWKSVPILWLDAQARAPKPQAVAVAPARTDVSLERFECPQKPYEMLEDVTVTRLVEAASAEQIRALMAEEPDKEGSGREEDEEPPVPANRFGTIYHQLMELSVDRLGLGDDPSWAEPWIRELTDEQKREVLRQAGAFWSGPWGERLRRSRRRYAELPFIYKTRHGLLKGQMDLVYQEADGSWTVLDYKTNRIQEGQLQETAARYAFQLSLYALVFSDLVGQAPARGILYFSSINKEAVFNYEPGFEAALRGRLESVHEELILAGPSATILSHPLR